MGRGLIQDRRPKLPLVQNPKRSALHQALASVSTGYSCVLGRLPTCYSPVRRSSTPEGAFPLDLHVLSTPPAFVLSQDQTLREQLAKRPPLHLRAETHRPVSNCRRRDELHLSKAMHPPRPEGR